jgi:hypothetical protein
MNLQEALQLAAQMAAQKQAAEWEAKYKAEQAANKLKADAIAFAINEYYQETKRCAECSSAKKTKMANYCDEHQGKINAAVDKRLSRR